MKRNLYKSISEQFSISDLDFSDNEDEYKSNIFNKSLIDLKKVYNDIINDIPIGNFEIEYLNNIESEYAVLDKDELIKIIKYYSINYPNDSLNWIDVSWITDMYELFKNTIYNKNNYNGDISKWDVSNVNSMEDMFLGSGFNQDISKWDVSNVTNMHGMFCNSKFNKDISKWDVSNVESMSYMFHGA